MLPPMRTWFLILVLVVALPARSGVYRWVDGDGRVHFSDRPVAGAEEVPGIQQRSGPAASDAATDGEPSGDLGTYTAFEIVSPEPNVTLRDAQGQVRVSLLLEPPLAEGHRLQLRLDGQAVSGEARGTQMALDGLPYGSHRLQAEIIDELDVPVAYTTPVDFHLRKPLPNPGEP